MRLRVVILGGLTGLALMGAGALAQESPAPVGAPAATATPVPALAPTPAAGPASAPEKRVESAPPAAAPLPAAAIANAPRKPKKRPAVPAHPLETALSSDPAPTLEPNTLAAIARAVERYARIVDAGGWPTNIAPLQPGSIGPAVARLRTRLAIEGDLDAADAPDGPAAEVWDPRLTAAVRRFQARMGLRPSGQVVGATLKAINTPAGVRLTQLRASARRLEHLSFPFGERYVVVNLPAASVEAVEEGRVVRRYVAIVGGVEHPSPEIAAHIASVNLNPTWTVPVSIIKNEIIPRMQRDPGYLTREKIRILDASGTEIDPKSINWTTQRATNYTLRQDSGAGNSLGSIRLNMPNKLAVYMHDTPSKRLFGADYRFLSHGCVRVQGVYDLAEWLLEGANGPNGPWDKAALLATVKEGAREEIRLLHPTPVIWVYLTGWANGNGAANFRDDVYGVDAAGDATASAAAPAPEAAPAPGPGFPLNLFAQPADARPPEPTLR